MAKLTVVMLRSLESIDDETLEEITADGHTFACASWFRMLDHWDLSTLTGGRVELRYAVAIADGEPVAVSPVLRCGGEGLYFVYSIRQYFFEHWIEEAVRLRPTQQAEFARLLRLVAAYRKALEWTGSRLDECLIVANPLSYRGDVAVSPSAPVPRVEIYQALLGELKRQARRDKLPLWFLCVPGEENRFGRTLSAGGCEQAFGFYDNQIPLDDFETFDDYLHSFRRTTRRAFERDIRRSEDAGVEFRFTSDLARYAKNFTDLYQQTYSKYGSSFFRQPPEFWTTLAAKLGPSRAEAIVAEHRGRLIGFSILLKNHRRGELWTYRIGRTADPDYAKTPFYFGLSFYGPIRRAIELGCRRIWLGPAGYEAKSVRGAVQTPLFSYFWFPRRSDRWLLAPYLKLFGQVSKEQIARSMERPLRLKDAVAAVKSEAPKDATS